MEQNLRGLFDRALDDEPAPPLGDLARDAMAEGIRLRRRRRLLAGPAAAGALAAVVALVLLVDGRAGTPPAEVPPDWLAEVVRPGCTGPVERNATDVAIFLAAAVTGDQRQEVAGLLARDPRVRGWGHRDRGGVYQDFARTASPVWRDASPADDRLPEFFRAVLAQPREYPAFRSEVGAMPGVEAVVGSRCP